MSGNAKNRDSSLSTLQLHMNEPKYQTASNSTLKLGLLSVSHTVALQNITCNNQNIKYPVFVGVCENVAQVLLRASMLGGNGCVISCLN